MDSATQAMLGAAVAVAVAGKQANRKTLLTGAAAGIFPDLDVLVLLAMPGDVLPFILHRGLLTHSLLMAPVFALLAVWLLVRNQTLWGINRKLWLQIFLWCFATHVLLDLCTSYGTPLFQPLSHERYALSALFIIDPFYTLPLLAAFVMAVVRTPAMRSIRRINAAALLISSFYLLTIVSVKFYAHHLFAAALEQQNTQAYALKTQNASLGVALWRATAMTKSGYMEAYYSLLHPERPIEFQGALANPQRPRLIKLAQKNPLLQRLIDFSEGFYRFELDEQRIIFTDLRFGAFDYRPFRFHVADVDGGQIILRDPKRIAAPSFYRVFTRLRHKL